MNANFIAPINNLSYGICGLNLALQLDKLINLSLFPIGQSSVNTSREDASVIQKCIENSKMFDRKAKSVRLFHQFSLDLFPSDYRIGFPIFELNKFNEVEIHHLKSCDEIFTCSLWGKKILNDNGIDLHISVIPLGVNRGIFKPIEVQRPNNNTIFLAPGKLEIRKGFDCLADWFGEAFEESDNVELWMAWQNHFIDEKGHKEWEDLYRSSKLGSKIRFVPYQQSPHQLNLVYNNVDCLVSLSRAEGWNLPLLEGLSCGREVIATDYSGHSEFLDGENSYPIEITEFETAYDGKWFHGQGEWAVLGDSQKEEFIQYVRKIHERKQNGDNLFNEKGIETAKLYSWEHSAKRIIEEISR